MRKESKQFFEKLLTIASPSGDEVALQKLWMNYVKDFADEIRTDVSGNAMGILNPQADFKVMLTGHADEISFMITYIDDKGFLYVTKAGGINPKLALGMRVRVLGKNGVIHGIVGVKAEHQGGSKGEVKVEDIYIDLGANSKDELEGKVEAGDYVIYDLDYTYMLNDRVAARGLDNRSGAFIVAEVLRRLKGEKLNVGVYSVSTVNEETNMGGAYFAAAGVEPNMAIACDVTFATDYSGLDPKKDGDVQLGGGPVLAKGSMVNKKINELFVDAAKRLDMKTQVELVPQRTGTDADKMRFTGKGVSVSLVSLPLRYMHSPSEVVSLVDIELEIDLIVDMIKNLKGDEELNPLF